MPAMRPPRATGACRHLFFFSAACLALVSPPLTASAETDTPIGLDFSYDLENTHIINYMHSGSWQDFNRLRLDTQTTSKKHPGLSLTLIGDGKIFYDTLEDRFDSEASLYRGYMTYEGERSLIAAGRQRIPFGVGRVWNPVDIFNPIDVTSIEPDERKGTDSVRVEYSISDLTIIDATLSEEKGAFRAKGYMNYADIALIVQYDDESSQTVGGWELEGELPGTGIELRSEGGIYYSHDTSESNLQAIIGAEYGFPNSLTLIVEFLHDGSTDTESIGLIAGYQLDMLTLLNGLVIVNLDDSSFLFAPSISYSLSDEMTLDIGMFLYGGEEGTELGEGADATYIRWFVHF